MKARYGTIGILALLLAGPAWAQNPYYDHGSFPSGGSLGSSAAMRAELDLIEAGFAKLPTIAGNASKVVIVNSEATALTATDAPIPSGAAFPASPSVNGLFFITDDTAAGACDSSGGSAVTLCRWDGADWVAVLGVSAAVTTLEQAKTNGRTITTATLASPVEIGNGTQAVEVGGDATLGGFIRPKPLGDSLWRIWTDYNGCIRDEESAANMLCFDPDAIDNNKYIWASGYRPIKTLSFMADSLYVAGAASLVTDTALVSGGLIVPYVLTTDSNSDYFYRYIVMDPKWDGGTVTATVTVVNTNATPANVYEVDVSGACYPAGTVLPTTISTTGEQAATITFGSSGSCGGSACNQNDPASATTAEITVNGTPAGGNLCAFQAQVDATATTETVSGVKVVQFDIHYKISKGF